MVKIRSYPGAGDVVPTNSTNYSIDGFIPDIQPVMGIHHVISLPILWLRSDGSFPQTKHPRISNN